MVIFHSKLLVYQRVSIFLSTSIDPKGMTSAAPDLFEAPPDVPRSDDRLRPTWQQAQEKPGSGRSGHFQMGMAWENSGKTMGKSWSIYCRWRFLAGIILQVGMFSTCDWLPEANHSNPKWWKVEHLDHLGMISHGNIRDGLSDEVCHIQTIFWGWNVPSIFCSRDGHVEYGCKQKNDVRTTEDQTSLHPCPLAQNHQNSPSTWRFSNLSSKFKFWSAIEAWWNNWH